jgi:hypothetical protein
MMVVVMAGIFVAFFVLVVLILDFFNFAFYAEREVAVIVNAHFALDTESKFFIFGFGFAFGIAVTAAAAAASIFVVIAGIADIAVTSATNAADWEAVAENSQITEIARVISTGHF